MFICAFCFNITPMCRWSKVCYTVMLIVAAVRNTIKKCLQKVLGSEEQALVQQPQNHIIYTETR